MTETRLREALVDLADSVPATDLVTGRWQEGARRRRRQGVAVALASAVAVAGIVSVAFLPDRGEAPPTLPMETPTVTPDAPDAFLGELPVYLSPDVADERILPRYNGQLPSSVRSGGPVERAVYAEAIPLSGVPMGITVIGLDGSLEPVPLPLDRLDLAYPDGRLPFTAHSLSPDGTRLALVTSTGFAVYDLRTRRWTEYDVGGSVTHRMRFRWWPQDVLVKGGSVDEAPNAAGLVVPENRQFTGVLRMLVDPVGPERLSPSEQRFGGAWTTDQMQVLAHPTPVAISVTGTSPALLAVNGGGREDCCAVAGWLDEDWVVYESRVGDTVRLIAWNTRDGQFMQVATLPTSTFAGGGVGSYADLSLPD